MLKEKKKLSNFIAELLYLFILFFTVAPFPFAAALFLFVLWSAVLRF